MATGNKARGTAVSMPAGIACGVVLSLVITCILAVVLTWLVLEGKIAEETLGYFVMGLLAISSALGSLLAALRIKRRWMMVCLLTGSVFYLILLIVTVVFFGGNFQGVGVSGLLVLTGAMVSGVSGLGKNRGSKQRYRDYRTR